MNKPIINISDVELKPSPMPMPDNVKPKYEGAKIGQIGQLIGAQKLGYNITVVPAGKRAFPFHNHRINEEAFFVLEGEGEVRIGNERYAIKKGDFIAAVAGGPEHAHQIINSSNADLKYIGISTKLSPEIADYPDSKKTGVLAIFGTKADGSPDMWRFLIKSDQKSAEYWEGEE